MTALELIRAARTAGLRLSVRGDRLVIQGPKTAASLAQQILAQKAEVKAVLSPPVGFAIRQHECGAGVIPCGALARLYPCGWRCDDHSPAAHWRTR